ncbi:MAG: DUF4062 domain-containing protein [Trueperaceae bacterium]
MAETEGVMGNVVQGAEAGAGRTSRSGVTIRTPDQRLRVFVSSTLTELAEERTAVRQAVGGLRLAPVMFELGARPHPPRELYRAYLEQSHIFVGIYWQKYGWLAPGMNVSGLEDEFLLSGGMPKLIYIKGPAPDREGRLDDLLDRIRDDDQASYKTFTTPDELRELVTNDLATMLSERFEHTTEAERARTLHELPVPPTPLVGRERELNEVIDLLLRQEVRLVTLMGPGGIGKSRLALAVAGRLKREFEHGVYFIQLAPVREPAFMPTALVRELGLAVPAGVPPMEAVRAFLHDKQVLLVLDNFEQILPAATYVADLLAAAPGLEVLVTSRAVLRITSEYEYQVQPLPLPSVRGRASLTELAANDAVRLFVMRARAVAADFELTEQNRQAISQICHRLEGVPLAIELAAARVKYLGPAALLKRLDRRLDVLTGGPRDLPDRQRTLRATFDWSFALLSKQEQRVFARLSMFVGGFTLAAAEAVAAEPGIDVQETLFSLADNSLLRHRWEGEASRFVQLETIREYAREKLAEFESPTVVACAHRDYFVAFTGLADVGLLGHDQATWLDLVERDQANIRAAFRRALSHGELSAVVEMGWNLWRYWWIRGQHAEGRNWMEGALRHAHQLKPAQQIRAYFVAGAMAIAQSDLDAAGPWIQQCIDIARQLGDRFAEGAGLLGAGLISLYRQDLPAVERELGQALTIFRAENDWWGQAHVLHYLWRYDAVTGRAVEAIEKLQESVALFNANGDKSGLVLILHDLAVTTLAAGDARGALRLLDDGFQYSLELRNRWYLAYCFEAQGCVAIELGDLRSGARYFGLADRLRDEVQAPRAPFDMTLYQPYLTRLEAGLSADEADDERMAGRLMHVLDAVEGRAVDAYPH